MDSERDERASLASSAFSEFCLAAEVSRLFDNADDVRDPDDPESPDLFLPKVPAEVLVDSDGAGDDRAEVDALELNPLETELPFACKSVQIASAITAANATFQLCMLFTL